MERQQLPDAVNCSIDSDFTQIPNNFIRNPKISADAKTILSILLSNKSGWKSHGTTLKQMMKEGRDAIQNGLSELEKFGYLKRIKYKSKQTKTWAGSFWAYTDVPFLFNTQNHIQHLRKCGFEPQPENQELETTTWKPRSWKSDTNNTNINNTNKNINKEGAKNLQELKEQNTSIKENRIIPPTIEMIESYCQEIKSIVDPENFFNFYTSKDWMIGKNKMKDWHCAIATWEKREQKDTHKIKYGFAPEDSIIENNVTFNLNWKWEYENEEKELAKFQLTKKQIQLAIGNKEPCKYQDNIRYNICPDGKYRHPESGELYIP